MNPEETRIRILLKMDEVIPALATNRDPWEKAREQIRRPAYAPGRQMEHESVDQYVRRQEHGRV